MTAEGNKSQALANDAVFADRVVVRPAVAADCASVQAIYAAHVLGGSGTFEEVPPDEADIAERWRSIDGRGLPYLVATIDDAVRGFAYAGPFRPRSAYRFTVEDSIYVDAAAMGCGLGGMLLDSLIERCTDLGLRQMVAVIGDSANTRSIRLHGRHGFRKAGVLVDAGFKFGRWLDAVFMQRALGEGASEPSHRTGLSGIPTLGGKK